jgi:hypothetical protein
VAVVLLPGLIPPNTMQRIRKNGCVDLFEPKSAFSVDLFHIKAYYSIVRMGKAKVEPAGNGTKMEFPPNGGLPI